MLQSDKACPKAVCRPLQGDLDTLLSHMSEAGLGNISEVFDGDAPHTPCGCIAQAWSVAELLRIKYRLDQGAKAVVSEKVASRL